MILIPGTVHQITWSVQNLSDTTTYYVRAVIRDTRTETVLATLDLTDLGGGRFSRAWNVPQDPSGFGREIEIEKTVYEDSGYTVPSGIYGRWLDNYTVFNLGARNSSTGGGGGHSVDYREIKRIIRKEIEEVVQRILDEEKTDTEVLNAIQSLKNDLLDVITAQDDTSGDEENQEAYMSKLTAGMNSLKEAVSQNQSSMKKGLSDSTTIAVQEFRSIMTDILSKSNDEKVELGESYMKIIESRLDKAVANVTKKFTVTVEEQGKKLEKRVDDAVKKPLNVTLAATTVQPEEKEPENPRTNSIKRMIQNV